MTNTTSKIVSIIATFLAGILAALLFTYIFGGGQIAAFLAIVTGGLTFSITRKLTKTNYHE